MAVFWNNSASVFGRWSTITFDKESMITFTSNFAKYYGRVILSHFLGKVLFNNNSKVVFNLMTTELTQEELFILLHK